jgi:hypothetical protein
MRTDTLAPRRLVALAALLALAAEPPPASKDWALDTVRLKNGTVFKGLVLEETVAGVRFQHVRRASGRPTVSMTTTLRRSDIARIEKIPDAERELLKGRLKELDPTGEGERKRMESLELKSADWGGRKNAGFRYDSDHFALVSGAPEEIVRRSAVRLEQVYTAYAHFLPPRHPVGRPTTILLYASLDEYRKLLNGQGLKLQNPAFFDPAGNRIVCGSNLQKLGDDLEKIRQSHREQRAELDRREAQLRQLYGKKPAELARHLQPLQEWRKDMAKADRYNDAVFDNDTRRLFATLYHEAFHAYVGNFVYPPCGQLARPDGPPGELPRWLNEGLAQVFETAIVEAGELRVGHADKERLLPAKEAVRKGELVPVRELIRTGQDQFLVRHADDRAASDRAYLASWALASYLAFDRRLLGTAALDEYVRAVNRKAKAEEAFARLVGQKLPDFERDFHAWLLKLQADGSLMESVTGKER